MRQLTIGILAHVDAGKTTLSESLLFTNGQIDKVGRVDKKDAFLDTNPMERDRGITIFSKQALLDFKDTTVTLLDTPGHVDFSPEMERTLQVLDYAILVISGADGVQGHTRTLWRLTRQYQIPTFLFVNKMDQPETDQVRLMEELKEKLGGGCVDFSQTDSQEFLEDVAVNDEEAMETLLSTERLPVECIQRLIQEQKVYPCFFGSALKVEGVEELICGLQDYTCMPHYSDEFGARIFKITRDDQGNRLTHCKITGGSLAVKTLLEGEDREEEEWKEKVNEIRIYSGESYETRQMVEAGTICALTGLTRTFPGEGLGYETEVALPILEPVLVYQIQLPDDCDPAQMLPMLRQLEEEEPELHIEWNVELQELKAQIMGQVQIEILERLIWERYHVNVTFGSGNIVYKETIANTVEGVGHFEPLRHYAEVHLLMEPGEPGSGLEFATDCSEDILAKNWQRLILTHLMEREHRGVLTGSVITDMRITIVNGRAHLKHTEGGDFRQATYRALRQGLRQAKSILLEPYYEFRMELPEASVGRAMMDVEKMKGTFGAPYQEGDMTILTGNAPVACMNLYQQEMMSYTKGQGHLYCNVKGYGPCHNQEEVIEQIGYDPEADLLNPTGSVFCAHGAGFVVPWDQVKDYMHTEQVLKEQELEETNPASVAKSVRDESIGTEEIDAILNRTYYANQKSGFTPHKGIARRKQKKTIPATTYKGTKMVSREEYLLVDGYNIVFSWPELSELAKDNMEGARGRLMDILCNYQGMRKCNLILVFDAYRVKGHTTEVYDYHNIHVVYTKEAETADQYIEKFAHNHGQKYRVTVATSDALEQVIIRGAGCLLMSSRELEREIKEMEENLRKDYL